MTDASNTHEGLYTSAPGTSHSCQCGSPKTCNCAPGKCQCGRHGDAREAVAHLDEPSVRTVDEAETHIEGTRWNDESPVAGDTNAQH